MLLPLRRDEEEDDRGVEVPVWELRERPVDGGRRLAVDLRGVVVRVPPDPDADDDDEEEVRRVEGLAALLVVDAALRVWPFTSRAEDLAWPATLLADARVWALTWRASSRASSPGSSAELLSSLFTSVTTETA